MKRTENVELTVLCLIRQGSQILLQNRIKADWAGYTLPGGHVEPGESIVDAVIREMREETGLTITAPKLCGVKQFPIEGGRYLVFLFIADQFEGTLRSSEEGKMEWVERNHIAQYATVSDLEEMLQVMEREDVTEFQYLVNGDVWRISLR